MSLLEWYVSRGRINRSTWWLRYALPIVLLSLLGTAADLAFGYTTVPDLVATDASFATAYNTGPFATVVAVLTFVPSISSNVTRLHDRGHSAWWLLLALVPEFVVFVGWVLYAIAAGHWDYSATRTLDVRLPGGIPVEEVLFFLVVPVCAVLALEAVRTVTGWDAGYPAAAAGREAER